MQNLKNPYYLALGVVSLAWWTFLVVGQLSTHHSCLPEDGMCNSGNTISGNIYWATLLTFYSLLPVWALALIIGMYLKNRQKHLARKK